jgi:hypothetical protein
MITERIFENPSVHFVLGNTDQINLFDLAPEIRICPGVINAGTGTCT